jgi:hypothetical protein
LFPYELRLRQPGVAVMGEQFEQVRLGCHAQGRQPRGAGARLRPDLARHQSSSAGRNSIPFAAVIDTEAEALRMIGRGRDARQFDTLAAATLSSFPQLRAWVRSHPRKLLEHASGWERVRTVLRWFVAHPRSAIYLRQLDIHGVDTKFIEARKGPFAELLDQVLPPAAILDATGPRQFEGRYGLLGKPPLIRFRMLEEAHYIGGLSDLTVPVTQFAQLHACVERVFVTENEINALAFPQVASSMVIFGGGYGIDRLAQIDWLRDRDIAYWGDIDTHGFAILDRLRAVLPTVCSLLMDTATFQAHRHLWGSEDADKRFTGELTRLTDDEHALYDALRDNLLGERLRLEQERIAYGWVTAAIRHG